MKERRSYHLVHEGPHGFRWPGKTEKQSLAKPAKENGVSRTHVERTKNHLPAGPDKGFLQQIELAGPHPAGTYYYIKRCGPEPIKGPAQIILQIFDNPQILTFCQELPD